MCVKGTALSLTRTTPGETHTAQGPFPQNQGKIKVTSGRLAPGAGGWGGPTEARGGGGGVRGRREAHAHARGAEVQTSHAREAHETAQRACSYMSIIAQ